MCTLTTKLIVNYVVGTYGSLDVVRIKIEMGWYFKFGIYLVYECR